jgi:hypothetical protein
MTPALGPPKYAPVLATTKYEPSGAKLTSRT